MLKKGMPQKTKAQKIAADQRVQTGKVQYTFDVKATAPSSKPVSQVNIINYSGDYKYVRADLIRIGIFTVLAFGAEIILKVVLQNR